MTLDAEKAACDIYNARIAAAAALDRERTARDRLQARRDREAPGPTDPLDDGEPPVA